MCVECRDRDSATLVRSESGLCGFSYSREHSAEPEVGSSAIFTNIPEEDRKMCEPPAPDAIMCYKISCVDVISKWLVLSQVCAYHCLP